MPITCEPGQLEGLTTSPSRDLPEPKVDWVIGIRTNNSPLKPMGLVQPDGLHPKLCWNGIAMHGNYSYWRFSRRAFIDARLMAKAEAARDRSLEKANTWPTLRRLVHFFYGVCLWFSLPLAVFSANGWLGLLSQGLAKTGALTSLEAPLDNHLPGNGGGCNEP